jgi:hypothetical protein
MTAKERYGEVFDTLNKLIKFLSGFFEIVDAPETYIFVSYLSLTYNSLWLGLLSAVRLHQVQAAMNMRQALEAGEKAAYALVFSEIDHFVIKNNDGTLKEKNNLKNSCYKWLEENYPEESKKIKDLKKSISGFFVHANFVMTQSTTDFSDREFLLRWFDQEDTLLVKASLWFLANITYDLIDLLAKVSSETKDVKLITDFKTKMLEYNKATEKIEQELMADPRFSKYLKP